MRPQTAALALVLTACSAPIRQDASALDALDVTDTFDSGTSPDAVIPVDVVAEATSDVPAAFDAIADVPIDAPPPVDTCRGTAVTNVWFVDPSMCLVQFASGLTRPRGLAIAPNGDVFVNDYGRITVLHDDNGDGSIATGERDVFGTVVPEPGSTPHGIAFSPDGAWLYASTSATVYRWTYSSGLHLAPGTPEVVVRGIPQGGHVTRTLMFDAMGRLYVSVGSASNLDQNPTDLATRAMIRRFVIPATVPAGGLAYTTGTVIASGMRNEVGLALDRMGRFWGVENGRDNAVLPDGTDVHLNNPGEELNRIVETGTTFYGYPSCWSEGSVLPGGSGPATQHGDIQSTVPAPRTDAWCQNAANVRPPAFVMPAHWAPLGVTEYTGPAFPADWTGDLVITSHGSWNSESGQVGRLLARARVAADGTVTSIAPILGQAGPGGTLAQGVWNVRPVDVRVDANGAMYFTDDSGGRVFRVGYRR